MSDDLAKQARDHAAVLSQLAHPLSEGMSDAKRIDEFVSAGNKAAALLVSLADEVARLREAMSSIIELEAQVAALSAEPTDKEADDLWYGISTADVRSFRAGIKSALTAFLCRRSQP